MQIAHSSIAWEHVLFKDVAVKVSNLEVYYRAVSFYLQEHPDLLVDLLKVHCLLLEALLPGRVPCFPSLIQLFCNWLTVESPPGISARQVHLLLLLLLLLLRHY